MAYATNADMKVRYDVRRLGELVKDDGTRASAGDLTTDTTLTAMLDDASAIVDSALIAGKRYSQADLSALTGDDAKLLVRIVCDLAYGLLLQRRGGTAQNLQSMAPGYANAMRMVDLLWNGEWIFDVTNVPEAGLPEAGVQLSKDKVLLTEEACRYFGDLAARFKNTRSND